MTQLSQSNGASAGPVGAKTWRGSGGGPYKHQEVTPPLMNVDALLRWYRANAREMPWRSVVTPYRTLVSELMLQQTRVETVIPYFERFMTAFPTVHSLANAELERVLEYWSGLGYYSRARNLHAAARLISANGGFPATLAGLLDLPGVGPYTAGAVGSIALGLDLPLVDGNVERVLCRQLGDPAPGVKALWAEADRLLPRGHAGDFNQALMELGATVCTPRAPKCAVCPVGTSCRGVDSPERFPAPPVKKLVPRAVAVAALIQRDGRILLARRPETGLLAGLWELPGGEGSDLGEVLATRLGLRVTSSIPLGDVVHQFTHLHLTTTVHLADVSGAPSPVGYTDARFVAIDEIDGMALSTLARKTLKLASAPSERPRKRQSRRDHDLPS